MTPEEQNAFMSKEYAEAVRYMDNAKEILQKAGKYDYGWYKDEKYVRIACGTAYLGVLIALDAWLTLKGVSIPKGRKHPKIDFYENEVAKVDKKMLNRLNTAYNILHVEGYYRMETGIKATENGFDAAYDIIAKIKPEHPVAVPETRGGKAKRVWNQMMVALSVMFMGKK